MPSLVVQVSNPESYSFDLPVLVGEVLGLLLALGRSERFVRAVVAEPDYSEEVGGGGVWGGRGWVRGGCIGEGEGGDVGTTAR